jgi:GNAT superfamily N-acetyltransferase
MSLNPGHNLVIRALHATDEPQWRRLWSAYLEYYETQLSEEIYSSTFNRLLSSDPQEFHGLIAELDGQPVGLTHYVYHRSCWDIENTCYLQDLFVDPHVRGKSIGRAMIEAVYKEADEAGCPSVYWQTQHFNEAGRRLYDRVGVLSPFIVYERS